MWVGRVSGWCWGWREVEEEEGGSERVGDGCEVRGEGVSFVGVGVGAGVEVVEGAGEGDGEAEVESDEGVEGVGGVV